MGAWSVLGLVTSVGGAALALGTLSLAYARASSRGQRAWGTALLVRPYSTALVVAASLVLSGTLLCALAA